MTLTVSVCSTREGMSKADFLTVGNVDPKNFISLSLEEGLGSQGKATSQWHSLKDLEAPQLSALVLIAINQKIYFSYQH